MKYLLMLISFSAMADDQLIKQDKYIASLEAALADSNVVIAQLVERIEVMQKQAEIDVGQATQMRGFLVRITNDCMNGKDFVSIDDANNIYRFHCQEAF